MRVILLGTAGLLLLLFLGARWIPLDPLERRPGGRLSGTASQAPADWAELIAPRTKVWVQTQPWYGIPHSVTTVSFALDGDLYVPCARCGTKRWPRHVARQPEVVVKVGDRLYERRAVRVEDPATLRRLLGERLQEVDDLWVFRMDPRD